MLAGCRPGPGFYRLTVLDADGAAVRATVQVRADAVIRAALILLALLGLAACASGDPDGATADGACPLIRLAEVPVEAHEQHAVHPRDDQRRRR